MTYPFTNLPSTPQLSAADTNRQRDLHKFINSIRTGDHVMTIRKGKKTPGRVGGITRRVYETKQQNGRPVLATRIDHGTDPICTIKFLDGTEERRKMSELEWIQPPESDDIDPAAGDLSSRKQKSIAK